MNIPYVLLKRDANTQYVETTSMDTEFILDQCDIITQMAKYIPVLNIKHPKYLKQTPPLGTGHNTAATLCEGMLHNFKNGQYTFSLKQLEALVDVFKLGEDNIEGFEAIVIAEVPKLPKLRVPVVEEQSGTTIGELFDLSGYEPTSIIFTKKI